MDWNVFYKEDSNRVINVMEWLHYNFVHDPFSYDDYID